MEMASVGIDARAYMCVSSCRRAIQQRSFIRLLGSAMEYSRRRVQFAGIVSPAASFYLSLSLFPSRVIIYRARPLLCGRLSSFCAARVKVKREAECVYIYVACVTDTN